MQHHRLITIGLVFLITTLANAAPVNKTTASTAVLKKEKSPFKIGLELGVDSNLASSETAEYDSNSYIVAAPSYRINKMATLVGAVEVDQKLAADRKTDLANTLVGITRDPILLGQFKFKPTAWAILPTNEKERNEGGFQGAGRLDLSLGRGLNLLGLKTDASYGLRMLKNAHVYERDNLGSPNISHALRHSIALKAKFNKIIGAGLMSYYQTGWTYEHVLRTSFVIQQEINISVTKQVTLTLFHRNGGNALDANGTSSNIAVYDDFTSYVGASLSMEL